MERKKSALGNNKNVKSAAIIQSKFELLVIELLISKYLYNINGRHVLSFVNSPLVRDIERLASAHSPCEEVCAIYLHGDLLSLVWACPRPERFPIPY